MSLLPETPFRAFDTMRIFFAWLSMMIGSARQALTTLSALVLSVRHTLARGALPSAQVLTSKVEQVKRGLESTHHSQDSIQTRRNRFSLNGKAHRPSIKGSLLQVLQ